MANRDKIWLFVFAGIVGLLGLFMFYLDETLAIWQYESPIWGEYYLNLFGVVFHNDAEAANWTDDGGTFLYAGIIMIAGCALFILAGLQGSKAIGFISIAALLGGLAYFFYSLVQFYDEFYAFFALFGGMAGLEGFEIIWSSNGDTLWRFGNGFFIIIGSVVISLIGLFRSHD